MVDLQAVKHVDDSIKSAAKADGQDDTVRQSEQRPAAHHGEPAEPTASGTRPAPSRIDHGDPLDDGTTEDEKRSIEDEKRSIEETGAIAWAQRISSFGDLGHKRRHDRMGKILAGLAMQPHASIPASTLDEVAADSTYEFSKNEHFKTADVVNCLALATADSCSKLDTIYAIQDTTEFNYSNLKTTTGLGPVNDSPKARGLHCHSTVAVDAKGILRGPLDIDIWAREVKPPAAKAQKSPVDAKNQANAND